MKKFKYIPSAIVITSLLAACASIGHPDGGPRDVEPPTFVSGTPEPGALNVTSGKLHFLFNENVQLDDPSNKIVVSPAQVQMPKISSNGKRISIELQDSLLPDATYTIDFGDAIKDLNEGNILDGFATYFSTGSEIDSLQISGMVMEARNLEPAQGMLVGVYATEADSAIRTLRFDRLTRTNQLGQFTLRNLPEGTYQLFAVNDVNRDLHWDRSEDVAFFGEPITPSAEMVQENDSVSFTNFLPNNLLLTWFNEGYRPQYMKNYARKERNLIALEMNAPVDSLPSLTILRGESRLPLADVSRLSRSEHGDTLNYWLTDSAIIVSDSLLVETRYRRVDSLDNIVWKTDTLKFNYRVKGKQAAPYVPKTLQEKIDSVRAISDTIPIDTFKLLQPSVFLNLRLATTQQDVNKPLRFMSDRVVSSIDFAHIRLQQMPDSTWEEVTDAPQAQFADSTWLMNFVLEHRWTPEMKYRLVVDSMAVADPYGVYNRTAELEFKVRGLDEYSSVTFNLQNLPDSLPAIVELLSEKDEPVLAAPVIGSKVELTHLMPGTYYARLFIDSDGNGEYTNGSLTELRQPEDTYYYPKKLTLKKNWDRAETWDIEALSPELQKPLDIKKNQPRKQPSELDQKQPDEEDEDDDY